MRFVFIGLLIAVGVSAKGSDKDTVCGFFHLKAGNKWTYLHFDSARFESGTYHHYRTEIRRQTLHVIRNKQKSDTTDWYVCLRDSCIWVDDTDGAPTETSASPRAVVSDTIVYSAVNGGIVGSGILRGDSLAEIPASLDVYRGIDNAGYNRSGICSLVKRSLLNDSLWIDSCFFLDEDFKARSYKIAQKIGCLFYKVSTSSYYGGSRETNVLVKFNDMVVNDSLNARYFTATSVVPDRVSGRRTGRLKNVGPEKGVVVDCRGRIVAGRCLGQKGSRGLCGIYFYRDESGRVNALKKIVVDGQ